MTLPKIDLLRITADPVWGMFGIVRQGNIPFCCSLELPWNANQETVSCIPTGSYTCERFTHKDLGIAYRVLDVPGRSGVLIHIGNLVKEIKGCILLGNSFDQVKTRGGLEGPGVASSRGAIFELMAATMNSPRFQLNIINRT